MLFSGRELQLNHLNGIDSLVFPHLIPLHCLLSIYSFLSLSFVHSTSIWMNPLKCATRTEKSDTRRKDQPNKTKKHQQIRKILRDKENAVERKETHNKENCGWKECTQPESKQSVRRLNRFANPLLCSEGKKSPVCVAYRYEWAANMYDNRRGESQ